MVLHEQTLLVKEKHLMSFNGDNVVYDTAKEMFEANPWPARTRPTRQTVTNSVFYDPTNIVYQKVWQLLWSNDDVPHHYNAETVGDLIEALCTLYLERVITGWAYPAFIDAADMEWLNQGGYLDLCHIVAWITWNMGLPQSMHETREHTPSNIMPAWSRVE